jgi:hypothetical protein
MKRLFLSSGLILLFASSVFFGQGPDWPKFRGPDSNPVSSKQLPAQWSRTENIEWFAEIPGRGWSSPIVTGDKVFLTTVTTDGRSKEPQIGTDFSNDFVAELSKQGLFEAEVIERVTARDIELPHEVTVHYWLSCIDILTEKGIITRFDAKTGKVTYKDRLDRKAGAFTSSPWAYGGHVFCLSEEAKTYVFTAGETFKMVRVNSLDEMAQATPAITADRLLIRTASRLYSIR